ncbi:hypothetical protein Alches_12830 [Alicyclobacillus hesperidum subsp. aegles]|uniref:Uncharacterized protein n=1 Tax=Alicyclobacillus tolerans TaxID=90970 RepID=A0A1M6NWY7_9BACL|nr:hypothetical protein [Alicyclobacillus montanus]GLG01244.1 hypothetical protein Alches_12830 [Alicyclobacillus hesperidum subsp. aegles]SHK00259.1 hypothetical protein SAMN05443507_10712 [Alicyclobacillus montanus]
MNKQRLRWWDISGQSESGTIFVYIVEATSRKKVIRRFGELNNARTLMEPPFLLHSRVTRDKSESMLTTGSLEP